MEPRRHTDQGNERKQQLLDAAEELFAEHGYARTRIADICAQAGVAKGLFYWYFPTKDALFAELVRSMRLQLRRAQGAAMATTDDPVDQIVRGTEASVRFIAEHRRYFALLDVERSAPEIAAVLHDGSDVYANDVVRLVRAAQRQGSIPDADPQVAAVGVLGAVSAYSQALRNGRLDLPVDELAELVGDWVRRALTGADDRARSGHAAPSP